MNLQLKDISIFGINNFSQYSKLKLHNSVLKETKRASEIKYIPLCTYLPNKSNSILSEHSREKGSTNRHSIKKSKPIKKFDSQNFGGRKSLIPLKIVNLPDMMSK